MNMGKLKRMDQVRLIIETYLETRSIKATSRRLHIARNTVKTYLRRVRDRGGTLEMALSQNDEELSSIVYVRQEECEREHIFRSQLDYWIKELRRVGVTKQLLWEEYRQLHTDGYGYSQFCERLKREIGRRDLTLSLQHKPGDCLQVDFAGKKMRWVDPRTGEVHPCEVLVGVLPYSHYTYAIALPSQCVSDFVHGLNSMLQYIGRLPTYILSDNLKSYVKKADKYDPEFNDLCVQLSAHYQIDLKATRVRKPKDKASVENAVKTAYGRIYAPLRNEVYHSLEELNEGIRQQLKKHNEKAYKKRSGSRDIVFKEEEQPQMRNLPSDMFEIRKITKGKVRRDYHVMLGEDKNYYSVPFQYVGKKATLIYSTTTVEVYIDNQRIALHDRLAYKDAYRHQTHASHMPKNHQEWKRARGFDAAYFLDRARKIGPYTYWAIEQVLLSRFHESQSYNSCHGIFKLTEQYSPDRLEKACIRCKKIGKSSLSLLRRILQQNLDQMEDQIDLFDIPSHQNIRGPQAYQ